VYNASKSEEERKKDFALFRRTENSCLLANPGLFLMRQSELQKPTNTTMTPLWLQFFKIGYGCLPHVIKNGLS
jgi:hypothetical protein